MSTTPCSLSLLILITFLSTGCGKNNEDINNLSGKANVKKIEGLYIFIESEPISPYDQIAEFKNGIFDKLLSASQKSVSEATSDILCSFVFDKNLKNIATEIKSKYPEANGVIFNDDMTDCKIIKYK